MRPFFIFLTRARCLVSSFCLARLPHLRRRKFSIQPRLSLNRVCIAALGVVGGGWVGGPRGHTPLPRKGKAIGGRRALLPSSLAHVSSIFFTGDRSGAAAFRSARIWPEALGPVGEAVTVDEARAAAAAAARAKRGERIRFIYMAASGKIKGGAGGVRGSRD